MISQRRKLTKKLIQKLPQRALFFCKNKIFSAKVYRIEGSDKRFLVQVSKKKIKSAVERNLVKRRTYSVLRDILDDIKPGTAIIFLLVNGDTFSQTDIKKDVLEILNKTKSLQYPKN